MTGIPAPENRSKIEQLNLAEEGNQDQETVVPLRMMSNHPSILKNSSTPTQENTSLTSTPWGIFSRQPTLMGVWGDSSLNLEPSESALLRRLEIIQKLTDKGFFNPDLVSRDEDTEHCHEIAVKVYTYGRPENTLMEVLLNMGRALNHAFPGNFEMSNGDAVIEYDPFAHDGEHVGHQEAIKFLPWSAKEE